MDLTKKKCVPCEGGVPKLKPDEIKEYLNYLETEWKVIDDMKIQKEFTFQNFVETMSFANKVAEIAEEEGHHPVMHVYYDKLEVDLWTHAIMGLSENDFIMAAKIEKI